MIFIWGQKTYCRKSVNPVDIGFPSMIDNIHITSFELTQRYGHLYWIPLFPMSLKWHARARDGKLYTISPSLEQQLKQVPYSHFSLIFAFAWPIILLVGMLVYKYKASHTDSYSHVKEQVVPNTKADAINNPMVGDYYHFLGARDQYAKVMEVKSGEILLSAATKEPKSGEDADIKALFADKTEKMKEVWVSKETLLKMSEPKSDFDTALFGPGELYLVEIQKF